MGIVEDLADQLAQDTLKAVDEHDDDMIIDRVAEILGADSITTQEAFMTAVRVRKADRRARVYLSKLKKPKP